MQDIEESWKICPFCGDKYVYEVIHSDDGYDWEGHGRGRPHSETTKKYCSCGIERALKENLNKIKPMCINCQYCKTSVSNGCYCVNSENLDKINALSESFSLETKQLKIKRETDHCAFYKFDFNKLNLTLDPKRETEKKMN